MTGHSCCREAGRPRAAAKEDVAPLGFVRRMRAAAGWIAPSVGLALMPKCPICLAAYLAIGTGIGVSLTTASYLRTSFEVLCLASLGYFAVRRLSSLIARSRGTAFDSKQVVHQAHSLN
jgi:hypothetical protein